MDWLIEKLMRYTSFGPTGLLALFVVVAVIVIFFLGRWLYLALESVNWGSVTDTANIILNTPLTEATVGELVLAIGVVVIVIKFIFD